MFVRDREGRAAVRRRRVRHRGADLSRNLRLVKVAGDVPENATARLPSHRRS